jgi:1-acyl-sn-glycerol-3-phosphate acyltransferase
MWGEEVVKITGTSLYISNEIKTPERGHMVLINHVNELDFPFDSLVIKLPYLANQQIKSAYLAYWWMKAMGSQVFDSSKSITIATSVRNLINGLKWASFIVYPEGHNSYSEDIKPLKKGMIKLAHERNIPVFVVLKAGLTRFETLKSGNVVGFKSAGVVYPSNFTDWEEFRDYIFDLMVKTKSELDQEIKEKFSLPGV